MDLSKDPSEDLQIELEALQATFDATLSISGGNASVAAAAVAPRQAAGRLHLQLALAPLTGGDDSSAYVLATLGLEVGAAYPEQPPTCSLVSSKGAPSCTRHDGIVCMSVRHRERVALVLRGVLRDTQSTGVCAAAHCRKASGMPDTPCLGNPKP